MKKLILATGAHRSGSTWTGRIISSAPGVRYIHEPFNQRRENSPLIYWFEYLSENTDKKHQEKVKSYIESYYSISLKTTINRALRISSHKHFYHFMVDLKKRIADRTLIEDPIAIMSAEWLYNSMNCDVVISIRHPAAFIASLKVKKWEFDFNNYLNQDALMKRYLVYYYDEIREYSNNKKNIIEQGILLWNTIYATIHQYKEKYQNEWYFVRHEDLSNDPLIEFKNMFDYLNLEFHESVKDEIINSSTAKNESDLKRNSKENIFNWKNRLSEHEITLIKEKTKPTWTKFYTEKDW